MKRIPKKMITQNKAIKNQSQEAMKMNMVIMMTLFMINDFNYLLLNLL